MDVKILAVLRVRGRGRCRSRRLVVRSWFVMDRRGRVFIIYVRWINALVFSAWVESMSFLLFRFIREVIGKKIFSNLDRSEVVEWFVFS